MRKLSKCIIPALLFLLAASAAFAQPKENEMASPPTFDTPEAAADQAKADILVLLEANPDLNLGIDSKKLASAKLAQLIPYVIVDFQKVLELDQVPSLSEIIASEKSLVAPFISGDEIVAIAEVASSDKGWRVIALGNGAIRSELGQSKLIPNREAKVTIYEIPNLQLLIYGAMAGGSETYALNFEEFTLSEPVLLQAFYPLLQKRAIEFEEEFGDRLKTEKLVR